MKQMTTVCEQLKHKGIDESYTRIRHKSGMTVCVLEKNVAVTYAALGVRCGSVDNRYRIGKDGEEITVPDGTAHFLEHKLFAAGDEDADAMARFAALGANADAYTTPDITAFLFSTAEHETESLSVLLDFVFHPYFTDENVAAERAIITQEIRMYDDQPTQRGYYNALESLYHKHPIRVNVGGTEESIAHITPDVLYRFYNAFYHPENMVLSIAGNVTPEEVLRICDAPIPCITEENPFETVRLLDLESDCVLNRYRDDTAQLSRPVLYLGIKDNRRFSDHRAREKHACAVDMVNDILFCRSSRIYNELYESGLINGRFGFEYEQAETYAYVMITAESDEPELVARMIREYLAERIRLHDITDEAYEICRRVMYAGVVTAFESAEDIVSECLDAALDNGELFQSIDIMMSVTKADLFSALDTLYQPEHVSVNILYPENGSNSSINKKEGQVL